MSRYFYNSDDELRAAVERLNLLFYPLNQFRTVTARKDHIDVFGVTISARQTYYKREWGGGFGNEIKLSVESMEKVCGVMLFANPWVTENIKPPELKPCCEYLPKFNFGREVSRPIADRHD